MWRQNGCGDCAQASKGISHEDSGPLHDLLEKGSGLLSPNSVIEWPALAKSGLIRCAKSQEIEAEHLPPLGRQFRGDATPVAARCPETMQEHEGWAMAWPQHPPMAHPLLILASTT